MEIGLGCDQLASGKRGAWTRQELVTQKRSARRQEHLSKVGNGSSRHCQAGTQSARQPEEAVTGTGGRGATALSFEWLSLALCGESQEVLENLPGDNGGGGGVALCSHRT